MKPDDETIELFKFLSRGNKLKIYPGSQLPANAEWHVCTSHHIEGVHNFKGVCSKCGNPVFFADNHSHLTKICITCFLHYAQNHEVESVGNVDSIVKASLIPKRN